MISNGLGMKADLFVTFWLPVLELLDPLLELLDPLQELGELARVERRCRAFGHDQARGTPRAHGKQISHGRLGRWRRRLDCWRWHLGRWRRRRRGAGRGNFWSAPTVRSGPHGFRFLARSRAGACGLERVVDDDDDQPAEREGELRLASPRSRERVGRLRARPRAARRKPAVVSDFLGVRRRRRTAPCKARALSATPARVPSSRARWWRPSPRPLPRRARACASAVPPPGSRPRRPPRPSAPDPSQPRPPASLAGGGAAVAPP